ncbi:hypothetical protein SDC9_193453 [bioreactor metagenome]|uniref:Uncharacterized protein n=1 Tax=bioreactor metagenome TaxID=1076179 RepID=A0A645I3P7_9ZZZZ
MPSKTSIGCKSSTPATTPAGCASPSAARRRWPSPAIPRCRCRAAKPAPPPSSSAPNPAAWRPAPTASSSSSTTAPNRRSAAAPTPASGCPERSPGGLPASGAGHRKMPAAPVRRCRKHGDCPSLPACGQRRTAGRRSSLPFTRSFPALRPVAPRRRSGV